MSTKIVIQDLQARVQEVIDGLVAEDRETGIQVAVYKDGKLVVDAVAGVADSQTGRLVTSDTPFHAASVGKGVVATTVHCLAERGLIDYAMPIVHLWPEFGAHGKEKATVAHALTHSAGVPGLPADITPEDLCDWQGMCDIVAQQKPWWPPGTATGYHGWTYGWLLGEIVRRATNKPVSQVLREEITEPLKISDEMFFGVPEAAMPRMARLEDGNWSHTLDMWQQHMPQFPRTAPARVLPTADLANRPDILRADIPAVARMSARAVARSYAALIGPTDGVKLISRQRLTQATAIATEQIDEIFGNRIFKGLGYFIGPTETQERPSTFGTHGGGGSAVIADIDNNLTFAVTKNRLTAGSPELSTMIAALIYA